MATALGNMTLDTLIESAPPYDAEIEWLESTGTQYIDTGVVATGYTSVEGEFSDVAYPTGTGSMVLFGSRYDSGGYRIISANVYNSRIQFYYAGSSTIGYIDGTPRHAIVRMNQNGASVNGSPVSFTSTKQDYINPIYIFRRSCPDGVDPLMCSHGRLHAFRIWEGSTLVRDYIPVRKNGLGYLYDRVSGTLYGNAADNGAGFAAACCGPDKVCATQTALAPVYDSSKTYAVGACVTHEGSLWKCTTAVSTAEAFNGAKWQNVTLLREALCDIVYPVGSIYTSVNSTSPAALFGGTWERITGCFLLAATDGGAAGGNGNASIAPGNTGGEAAHKLTNSELPKLSGTFEGANNIAVNNSTSTTRGFPTIYAGSGIVSSSDVKADQVQVNSGYHTVKKDITYTRKATISIGNDGSHNNMPPYLAVYVWKRTA